MAKLNDKAGEELTPMANTIAELEETVVAEEEKVEDKPTKKQKEKTIMIRELEKHGYVKPDFKSRTANFATMTKYKVVFGKEEGNITWVELVDCGVYVPLLKSEYVLLD